MTFLSEYFENWDNVAALVQELELVPASMCTKSVLAEWRSKFLNEVDFVDEFTKDWLKELALRYQKANHHKCTAYDDLQFRGSDLKLF